MGKVGFVDQVSVLPLHRTHGDSGSLVVDKESGKIVGLHFMGGPDGQHLYPDGRRGPRPEVQLCYTIAGSPGGSLSRGPVADTAEADPQEEHHGGRAA